MIACLSACFCMCVQMDLSIGVAIGSSTQIALFLIPFVTLLGWAIDQPMSLNFSSFETIAFMVAVSGDTNHLRTS